MALAEDGDRLDDERCTNARVGAEPQASRLERGDRLQLRLGGRQALEQRSAVADQRVASRSQSDRPYLANDQLRPDLPLERRHLLGDGGLRVVEGVGGGGERATVGELREHPEACRRQHDEMESYLCIAVLDSI